MAKPKVGVFDFTGCEGCQLQILNCEDVLLDVLGKIEIVNFREAIDEKGADYDIALIDGGITTPADIERIKRIREKAGLLITIGSCSSTGGINCLKNFQSMEEVKRIVYGDMAKNFETIPARPASAVVKVDFSIPGCPIDKEEFVRCLTELLAGKTPEIPNYPVCAECKLKENECVFDKGLFCLGPVTRAGCQARCPSYGNRCEGCRGLIDNPNINAEKDILEKYGLSVERVLDQFKLFQGYYEQVK
jgi:coenzyme F420-reducing hydrogenase gamma subunit